MSCSSIREIRSLLETQTPREAGLKLVSLTKAFYWITLCVRACVDVDHLLNGDVLSDHVLHPTDLSHHTQLHHDIEGVDDADDDDDDDASNNHTQLQADDDTSPHSQEARLVALDQQERQQPERTVEEQPKRTGETTARTNIRRTVRTNRRDNSQNEQERQ